MPRISFARTLVTGVSRQLTNEEHWTLFYFEDHASKCPLCYNPVAVQQSGRALCDDGRDLAISVAALLFRLRADGHVYAKEEHQYVRVEMPAKYEHASGLFKAIEASKRGILERPRSMDAHFLVRPRIPAHYPVGGHPAAAASAHDYEFDYDPRAAQYVLPARGYSPRRASPRSSPRSSTAQFPQRWSRESRDSARWSRGSLFDDDQQLQQLREVRERQARYDAAPSFHHSMTWPR